MGLSLKDFVGNAVGAVVALGVVIWFTGPVVHDYPVAPIWLRIMVGFAAFAVLSCIGQGIGAWYGLIKYRRVEEPLVYPLLLIPLILWISYVRYAAAILGTTFDPFVHSVIYFDQVVLGWFQSAWAAIFPVSPFDPQVEVVSSPPQTAAMSGDSPSVVTWLLDSAWSIVLGLISSAIFAVLVAFLRKRQAET